MSGKHTRTPSGAGDGKVARARDKPAKPAGRAAPSGGRPAEVAEVGGPKGPEPTRYGDWEKGGRCTDF